jgi:predicted nuclease of predicted toxin-antitoxin system
VKFLLDVCVSSRMLTQFLIAEGHDVVSAMTIDPRASDKRLLEHALQADCVLLTEDKDFGELAFVQGVPHGPVVRLVELSVQGQVEAMRELLNSYTGELTGPVILTASRGRIRVRRRDRS